MAEREGILPDVPKCQLCIFFRVYPAIECLRESAGAKTILASSVWMPDKKVPASSYPDCQEEVCS